MMDSKQRVYGIGLLFVLLLSFPGPGLEAGTSGKTSFFYVNGGIWKGNNGSDLAWTAGLNLDLQVSNVILSPEVMVLGSSSLSDSVLLAPAAILNVKAGNIYAGAGLGALMNIGGGSGNSWTNLMAKINAVFKIKRFRVTLYLSFLIDSDSDNRMTMLGLTAGFRF